MTPDEFVAAIRAALAARDYDRYLRLDLADDRLRIELRWMGSTRFDYRIEPMDGGFRAELLGQKVSPFHAVFSHRFDEYFERALEEVGATSI
jgi:hypothetical protein